MDPILPMATASTEIITALVLPLSSTRALTYNESSTVPEVSIFVIFTFETPALSCAEATLPQINRPITPIKNTIFRILNLLNLLQVIPLIEGNFCALISLLYIFL